MPQNGIHAIVGAAVARKWMPKKEWLVLGVVLGNMFPDLDNLVVAYATLAKLPEPEHYHRTFTHSIFTMLAMLILFYVIAAMTRNEKWKNFGIGFGAGILMNILVDLVLWFNGDALFWPIPFELNFWSWFTTPAWLTILLDTAEFLAFGLYFLLLVSLSRTHGVDADRQRSTKTWAYIEFLLFIVFTVLFFSIGSAGLHYQVYGGLYLVSLLKQAAEVAERLRFSIENHAGAAVRDIPGIRITSSCGVASIKLGAKDPAELIDQADNALYQSKQSGRNEVSVWAGERSVSSTVEATHQGLPGSVTKATLPSP